jgi:hypothetical protein
LRATRTDTKVKRGVLMSNFLSELRRRRVFPVAGACLAAGFLAVEIV